MYVDYQTLFTEGLLKERSMAESWRESLITWILLHAHDAMDLKVTMADIVEAGLNKSVLDQ